MFSLDSFRGVSTFPCAAGLSCVEEAATPLSITDGADDKVAVPLNNETEAGNEAVVSGVVWLLGLETETWPG